MRLEKLVFTTTYGHLPEVVGGLQTTIHEICLALKSRGIEPVVNCGFDGASGTVSRSDRSDTHLGYLVVRSEKPESSLASVATAFSADAICVLTGRKTVPMIIAALESDHPTTVYLHNVEYAQFGGVLVPNPALHYFSNSRFTAGRIRAMFGIESSILTPLVEREKYQVSTTREKVLFINPTHLKGVEIMFQIAERLPHIPFQVAESWVVASPWRNYCHKRAESLGNIEWLSSTRDMRTLYGSTRLLLMPSIWEETYGRCVTEAQLNAIPVIGSNRGGLPEAIGKGGLTLDAEGDIADWIEAVDRVFTNQSVYDELSKVALNHAMREEISPEHLVSVFIDETEKHLVNSRSDEADY